MDIEPWDPGGWGALVLVPVAPRPYEHKTTFSLYVLSSDEDEPEVFENWAPVISTSESEYDTE